MSRRRGRRAFLRSPARVVAATSEGSASATKDQTSAEPDPLKRLKDLGAIATAGLGAITTVLGVFGLREGIPERMLRNQPVAASLAFLLVGLGITLAVLSVAWFSKEHPRVEALRPRDERPDEQASKWARLRFQARRNWGLFLFGSTVFLAVVLFLLLSVGSLLGEIGLSFMPPSPASGRGIGPACRSQG